MEHTTPYTRKTGSKQRYDHINFVPNASVSKAARRGLKLRDKFKRGGNAGGTSRGKKLESRKKASPAFIRSMLAYFDKHSNDKSPGWSKPSDPSDSYIDWMLYGGDAGRSWARRVAKQVAAADAKHRAVKTKKQSKRPRKVSTRTRLAWVQRRIVTLARLNESLSALDSLKSIRNV